LSPTGFLIQPIEKRAARGGRTTVLHRLGGHQARRGCVGADHRERGRVAVDEEQRRGLETRGGGSAAHECGRGVRVRKQGHVRETRLGQGVAQVRRRPVVLPAQPGGDQPMSAIGHHPVGADDRRGESASSCPRHVDDGLIDHAIGIRCIDERKMGDAARDRHP
jgi:hypothetical protein